MKEAREHLLDQIDTVLKMTGTGIDRLFAEYQKGRPLLRATISGCLRTAEKFLFPFSHDMRQLSSFSHEDWRLHGNEILGAKLLGCVIDAGAMVGPFVAGLGATLLRGDPTTGIATMAFTKWGANVAIDMFRGRMVK